jgi:hypothetical protein
MPFPAAIRHISRSRHEEGVAHVNKRENAPTALRAGIMLLLASLLALVLSAGWGPPTPASASDLASAARAAGQTRQVGVSLANLTYAPDTDERTPTWSPLGTRFAFTSDGRDLNGDGRIDTRDPYGQRSLYLENADGSGLQSYDVLTALKAQPAYADAIVQVVSVAWRPDSAALYVVVRLEQQAGLSWQFFSLPVSVSTVTAVTPVMTKLPITLPAGAEVGALTLAPSGLSLYFEMKLAGQQWQVYSADPLAGGAPTKLTTQGNNRYPAVAVSTAAPNGELLFASSRSGHFCIYKLPLAGNDPNSIVQLTMPPAGSEDTWPRLTADGRLVFVSTRRVSLNDGTSNANVWVMPYGVEGSGTPPIEATVRFFPKLNDQSTQTESAPEPLATVGDRALFATNKDGSYEIYVGSLSDSDAPYITQPPTVKPSKFCPPGATVTVAVPVADLGSGIRNVWLQIKDPDPGVLENDGQNHVLTRQIQDVGWGGTDKTVWTERPIEFGPLDPVTGQYLDLTDPHNHPGYYARAGSTALFTDEGQGYPDVAHQWLPMFDDGTHGDVIAGDGEYACQWVTPAALESDWYFDVIVEDMAQVQMDGDSHWHGNRRRFDNVGGCTTLPFAGGRDLLFVDDYLDGQRFQTVGLPPASAPTYSAAACLNGWFYFTGDQGDPAYKPPFAPGSEFGGANVWRILARGPVPDSILSQYLPLQVTQVSLTDKRSATTVAHGSRAVVWAAPSPGYRLLPAGSGANGSGSISDTLVQASLADFVTKGGRLFLIGSDIAQTLTAGGTKTNSFLSTTLGVQYIKGVQDLTTGTPPRNAFAVPHTLALAPLTNDYAWYGYSLPAPRWVTTGTDGYLIRNDNPSQFVSYDPLTASGTQGVWDTVDPTAGSLAALVATPSYVPPVTLAPTTPAFPIPISYPLTRGVGTTEDVVAVSRTNATSGSRLVYWTFGYEHISCQFRPKVAGDTLEWLLDGKIRGRVAQDNSLGPVADALVIVSQVTPSAVVGALPTVKDIGAVRTDAFGSYEVAGLAPGANYRVTVVASGFTGVTLQDAIPVHGHGVTSGVDFYLYRDTNTCTLSGFVTESAGGSPLDTRTTDAYGKYDFNLALPAGEYLVEFSTEGFQTTSRRISYDPTVGATVDMNLISSTAVRGPGRSVVRVPNSLSGTVTGDGGPLANVTVSVSRASTAVPGATVDISPLSGGTAVTTTTDANGRYEATNLPAGAYLVTATRPTGGSASTSRTLTGGQIASADINFGGSTATVGRLSGTVMTSDNLPVVNATVAVRSSAGVIVASGPTDADGRFAFQLDQIDTYTVSVSAAGFAAYSQAVPYLPSTGKYLSLTLSGGTGVANLYGRVYENTASGPAVMSGVTIELLADSSVITSTTSGAILQHGLYSHNFSFLGLSPGTYRLRFSVTGRRTVEVAVSLAAGSSVGNVEVFMEPLMLLSPGVTLISFPGDFSGADFSDLLGVTAAYLSDDGTGHSRIYGYDPTAATSQAAYDARRYNGVGTLAVTPGAAYWLKTDRSVRVQREGIPVNTNTPFLKNLSAGWNLVSDPFSFSVDLYDCTVTAGGIADSWVNVIQGTNPLVSGTVYTWTGSRYLTSTSLQPYAGYWVYAYTPCTLGIPPRETVRAVSPSTRETATAGSWQVSLQVSTGSGESDSAAFGIASTARDGFDFSNDQRKPPTPPLRGVSLAFDHTDWGTHAGTYASDIRSNLGVKQQWQFHVTSPDAVTPVTLAWPNLQAQIPAGYQAMLIDQATGQRRFMGTTTGYTFSDATGGRDFTITVTPRGDVALVTNLLCTETATGTAIRFTLSDAASAVVTLRSVTGRKAWTTTTSAAQAGNLALYWDGRETNGAIAPPGLYLCEVRATDATGRQMSLSSAVSWSGQR